MMEQCVPTGQMHIVDIPFRHDVPMCPFDVIQLSELHAFLQRHPIAELTAAQQNMLIPLAARTALDTQERIKTQANIKYGLVRNGRLDVQLTRPQFDQALQRLRALDPKKDKNYIQEQLSWFEQYLAKMRSKTFA